MTSVRTIPSTTRESPTVAVRAPRRSKSVERDSERPSAIMRCAKKAAASAIGTLTNRIQRQPSASVMMPPRSTPAAPPAPPIAPQMPTARLRSRPSLKVVVRIDSDAGAITAPPSPWIARAAISWS